MPKHSLLITGGSSAIAQSLLQLISPQEYHVILVGRERTRLEHSAEQAPDHLALDLIVADVSQPEGAQMAMEQAQTLLGTTPTHLVHAAGSTLLAPLHRTTDEAYRACLQANLDSTFFTLRAWVQGRLKAPETHGAAVVFTSVVAHQGVSNHEAIAAAKGAVAALVPAIAASYSGHGIRINGIAPGLTRTAATERLFKAKGAEEQINAQYPLGRHGHSLDQAQAAAWLLSDAASWITGQILPVDGGFTAVRPMVRTR